MWRIVSGYSPGTSSCGASCVNFPLVSVPGLFYSFHHLGLERVSLLEQLVHTLRIRTLDANV
jgi:hypothetical protein